MSGDCEGGERGDAARERGGCGSRIGLFVRIARNGMIRRAAKVGRARDVTCKVLKRQRFWWGLTISLVGLSK